MEKNVTEYLSNVTLEGVMLYFNIVMVALCLRLNHSRDDITEQHHDLECDIAFIQQFNNSLNSDAE